MRLFKRQAQHIELQELSDFIDDRLSVNRRGQVEAHLASCGPCLRELEGLQYAVGLLKQAPMAIPRRRLVMQEPPIPIARPMMVSWAYGAAASVAAVLLAVVLGADLMGALPGGGRDSSSEQDTFSDAQFSSAVPMAAEFAESEDEEASGEMLMEPQIAAEGSPAEAMESESADEAKAARNAAEVTAEADDAGESTHGLWRVLEGVLAATMALFIVVGLFLSRRSRR